MPMLDQVQRTPPRESIGVMHEREMAAEPAPVERTALDLLPESVVEGGETAVDVLGRMRFADPGTIWSRIKKTFGFGENSGEGATLRESYTARRANAQEPGPSVQQRREEVEARRAARAAERDRATAEREATSAEEVAKLETEMFDRLKKLGDQGLSDFEKTIQGMTETPWRQRTLDAIAAERDRRAQ